MNFYSDNTNLAYDLSRFDTTERDRREKARREANKIKMTPAVSLSKSGSKTAAFVAVLAIFSALFAANYFNIKKDDAVRMVTEQRAALEQAMDDNELLQSRLDSIANIGYIEQYATENLGMTKVSASQKKFISINTESLIETQADESEGFVGSVKKWFGSILEYIGF